MIQKCYLISKHFGEFFRYLSVTDFYFHSIVIGEYSLHNSNPFLFIETCFVVLNMALLVNVLCVLKRNVYLLLLGRMFCKYQLGQIAW